VFWWGDCPGESWRVAYDGAGHGPSAEVVGESRTTVQLVAEAEYRVVANSVAEISWLRQLLQELHFYPRRSSMVFCDNVSAVYLSTNLVQHQRTKHVEIDLHFIRDKVATGEIRVLHVPSTSRMQMCSPRVFLHRFVQSFAPV
jgi:hypothetical protein